MQKPGPFQTKLMWSALTALAFAALASFVVGVGWLAVTAMGFLQPLLLPLAVAGIIAYLVNPVVNWICRLGVPRIWAVVIVFALFFSFIALLALWVVPSIYRQGATFAHSVPEYTQRAQTLLSHTVESAKNLADLPIFKREAAAEGATEDFFNQYLLKGVEDGLIWLQNKLPDLAVTFGNFLLRGIGGAFGAFGFLLSMVLVPIFLFFFLSDGPKIASSWSDYLPLRASPLKSEIVSLLSEINDYLIAFFRGQLLVSLIDGFIIGVALLIMGMDFAILIGLLVGILGLIPYAGVIISWIPAVLIATAQWGDWYHPLIVTIIFLVVNNLDGMIIAPRIVGESVGLHPLTVIISVLAWSLILGGLLGALLAVPLTATLKVVLKRYFWDRPGPPLTSVSTS